MGHTLVKYLQTNCMQNIYEEKRKRNGLKSKPMKLPVLQEDVSLCMLVQQTSTQWSRLYICAKYLLH